MRRIVIFVAALAAAAPVSAGEVEDLRMGISVLRQQREQLADELAGARIEIMKLNTKAAADAKASTPTPTPPSTPEIKEK